MKINAATKYHIYSTKMAIVIFYIIMIISTVLSFLLSLIFDGNTKFGGISESSVIFLFVIGICSFTGPFKMMMQNGVSRNELWKSFIKSSALIASAMSAIDLFVTGIASLFMNVVPMSIVISSAYLDNSLLKIINSFFLQVALYVLAISLGYFIRLIYYRLNKLGRTIISISVPVFLFIGLPMIELHMLNPVDWSLSSIIDFFAWTTAPYNSYGLPMLYIYLIAVTVILLLLSKKLIQNAQLK